MKVSYAIIACAILAGAFVLPGLVQPAYAVTNTNSRFGSLVTNVSNGATTLIDIEYTTTTTKTWTTFFTGCAPNCTPFWSEVHFVKGYSNDNYSFQCGVSYDINAGTWRVWLETLDPSGTVIGSTRLGSIAEGTSVTLQLAVPAYTGASNVQCTGFTASGNVIIGAPRSASNFKLISALPSGMTAYTGVMTEYTDGSGSTLTGSTVGTASYSSPKFVDTSFNQPTQTKAVQMIFKAGNNASIALSPVTALPVSFSAQTFTVATSSVGKVTTT